MIKKASHNDVIIIFMAFFPLIPSFFELLNMPVYKILGGFLIGITIWQKRDLLRKTIIVKNLKLNIVEKFLIVWMGWKALTCVINGELSTGIWYLCYIAICMAIVLELDSEEKIHKVIDVMIYISVTVSTLGILECITHFNAFSLLNTIDATLNYNPLRFGILRIITFSSHTIHYCLYCMFALSLLFYRIVNEKQQKKYYFFYILILINAVLTLSRSALLCLFLCQFALLFFYDKKKFVKRIIKLVGLLIAVLVVVAIFVPKVWEAIKAFAYMFLVIVNDKFAVAISDSYGTDNLYGIGNRIDLYSWVWEELKGNFLWGEGPWKEFLHKYTIQSNGEELQLVKKGIEVNYLSILYHFGIVTLVLEVLAYIGVSVKAFREKNVEENKLSFGKTFAIMTICYMIAWFAVGQGSEFHMYIMILAIYLSYSRVKSNFRD